MQEKHLDKNKNECLKIKRNRIVFSFAESTLENLNIFEMPLLILIKRPSHFYCSVYTNCTTYSLLPWLHTSFPSFFQLLKFLGGVLLWFLLISPLPFAHIWVYYGIFICILFLFISWSHNQLCCNSGGLWWQEAIVWGNCQGDSFIMALFVFLCF